MMQAVVDDWRNARIPAVDEAGDCHADTHTFGDVPRDGERHDLTCKCGSVAAVACRPVEGAFIYFDLIYSKGETCASQD